MQIFSGPRCERGGVVDFILIYAAVVGELQFIESTERRFDLAPIENDRDSAKRDS